MKCESARSSWEAWLFGLTAAFIGGGAGSVTSGIASMGIDPQHFNLRSGLYDTVALMGAAFLVNGLLSACLYLRQSPLPGDRQQGVGGPLPKLQAAAAPVRR